MNKAISRVLVLILVLSLMASIFIACDQITVELDQTTLSITVGQRVTLVAECSDESKTIEFSSDKDSVATVTAGGRVEGKGVGTAVITAAVGDVKATCTVTVSAASTEAPVITISVTLANTVVDVLTEWESLYVVGSFEGWSGGKSSYYRMNKDATNNRLYTLTIDKKYEGGDYYKAANSTKKAPEENVFEIGDSVEYKFAIGPTESAWSCGEKQADGTNEVANRVATIVGGQNSFSTTIDGFAGRITSDPSAWQAGNLELTVILEVPEDFDFTMPVYIVGGFGADGDAEYWKPGKATQLMTRVEGENKYQIVLGLIGGESGYQMEGAKPVPYKFIQSNGGTNEEPWDNFDNIGPDQATYTYHAGNWTQEFTLGEDGKYIAEDAVHSWVKGDLELTVVLEVASDFDHNKAIYIVGGFDTLKWKSGYSELKMTRIGETNFYQIVLSSEFVQGGTSYEFFFYAEKTAGSGEQDKWDGDYFVKIGPAQTAYTYNAGYWTQKFTLEDEAYVTENAVGSEMEITVNVTFSTAPGATDLVVLAGNFEGSNWNPTNEACTMTKNQDGTYSITIKAAYNSTIEYKVCVTPAGDSTEWLGNNGNNFSHSVSGVNIVDISVTYTAA